MFFKFIYVFVYLRFDIVSAYIASSDWTDDQWTVIGKDVEGDVSDLV